MDFPSWKQTMLPILKVAQDGSARSRRDFEAPVGEILGLTSEQMEERVASGISRKIYDRVQWALFYMWKAGLLAQEAKGQYVITQRGKDLAMQYPQGLDLKVLRTFPDFEEYYTGLGSSTKEESASAKVSSEVELTPDEQFSQSIEEIKKKVAEDLLGKIRLAPAKFFEVFVLRLLEKMNYGWVGARPEVTGGPNDHGIDGIIREDRLGLEAIYVQAKRYASDNKVPESEIRNFAGSLRQKNARKGVFITTSSFPATAKEFVKNHPDVIRLIDGDELAKLCIEFELAVVKKSYSVPALDVAYFEEG